LRSSKGCAGSVVGRRLQRKIRAGLINRQCDCEFNSAWLGSYISRIALAKFETRNMAEGSSLYGAFCHQIIFGVHKQDRKIAHRRNIHRNRRWLPFEQTRGLQEIKSEFVHRPCLSVRWRARKNKIKLQ
jgi:hypothetical protein